MSEAELQLVRAALADDREAVRRLVTRLRPVAHAEVAHILLRAPLASGRSARQEVEDLVQEVFARLWMDGGKLLLQWDPARGRSLDSWVRLVARSRVLDLLRSRRHNPWQGEPMDEAELERAAAASGPAAGAAATARDSLERLQLRLRGLLSERDWQLFIALFAEGCPVAQVSEEIGMTPAAVYQWKSRFVRKLLPPIAEELQEDGAT